MIMPSSLVFSGRTGCTVTLLYYVASRPATRVPFAACMAIALSEWNGMEWNELAQHTFCNSTIDVAQANPRTPKRIRSSRINKTPCVTTQMQK